MTITVKQAKDALELAQAEYLAADIEHPTDILVMKDALKNARYRYWASCAVMVERIPGLIVDVIGGSDYYDLCAAYTEITGEDL